MLHSYPPGDNAFFAEGLSIFLLRDYQKEDLVFLSVRNSTFKNVYKMNPTFCGELPSDQEAAGVRVKKALYATYGNTTGGNQMIGPGCSYAIFDKSKEMAQDAWLSIGLTSSVIMLFVGGAFIITSDANKLIVAPIEKLTKVMRKMASQIIFLSANSDEDKAALSDGSELDVIDTVVEKMASIFGMDEQGSKQANPDLLTQVALQGQSNDAHLVDVANLEAANSSAGDFQLNFEKHPELASLEAILDNPLATAHFRLFLNGQFTAENLLFYEEVDKYRRSVNHLANHLHRTFVAEDAPQQVNIEAILRKAITDNMEVPDMKMFDAAQFVCLGLMRTNSYSQFLVSKSAKAFLTQKEAKEAEEAPPTTKRRSTFTFRRATSVQQSQSQSQMQKNSSRSSAAGRSTSQF